MPLFPNAALDAMVSKLNARKCWGFNSDEGVTKNEKEIVTELLN
jgi:hypothetical protein